MQKEMSLWPEIMIKRSMLKDGMQVEAVGPGITSIFLKQ